MSTLSETRTETLELPDVDLVYDVRGPVPPADGRPLLFMIGQPMQADGFGDLAAQFPDRTVVTYDPRGLGRSSVRRDGRDDQTPQDQADDLHALKEHLSPDAKVDVFGSSGGAVAGLTWVDRHPDDIATLLAHEPPATWALPNDAEAADRAFQAVRETYQEKGAGHGMAGFMGLSMWQGEFGDDYFAQPAPDPAMFGMPTDDDGSRDDMLLSDRAITVTRHRFDVEAIKASPARVLIGVGEETGEALPARTGRAVAALLGSEPIVFPSHHGGFVGGGPENPYAGKPEEFAVVLRQVLDGS